MPPRNGGAGRRGHVPFKNVPHVNNGPLKTSRSYAKLELKPEPPSGAMAEASFGFQMAEPVVRFAGSWLLHARTTTSFCVVATTGPKQRPAERYLETGRG
jgi:hypothetical protein